MSSPLVSVIIPVYREGEILSETIDSVLAQTFRDFEVIIVNNNADEVSLSVIKKYVQENPDLVRVVDQPIQGAPSARNKGVLESKGKYIAMLEGDDLMYPHRLETQVNYFEKANGDISLLSSYYDRVDWENKKILEIASFDKKFYMRSLKIEQLFWSHPSSWLFEKETALSVGMFNEAFNPRLIEDDEFNFKMFLAGNLVCLPERLIRVRMPSNSYQNIKDSQATSVHVLTKLDLFFMILREKLNLNPQIKINHKGFHDIRAQWLREEGIGFMGYSNGKKFARSLILEALKEKPMDYKNWKEYFRSYYKYKTIKNLTLSAEELQTLERKKFFCLD